MARLSCNNLSRYRQLIELSCTREPYKSFQQWNKISLLEFLHPIKLDDENILMLLQLALNTNDQMMNTAVDYVEKRADGKCDWFKLIFGNNTI